MLLCHTVQEETPSDCYEVSIQRCCKKKHDDALLAEDRRLEMLHNTMKKAYERLAEL